MMALLLAICCTALASVRAEREWYSESISMQPDDTLTIEIEREDINFLVRSWQFTIWQLFGFIKQSWRSTILWLTEIAPDGGDANFLLVSMKDAVGSLINRVIASLVGRDRKIQLGTNHEEHLLLYGRNRRSSFTMLHHPVLYGRTKRGTCQHERKFRCQSPYGPFDEESRK